MKIKLITDDIIETILDYSKRKITESSEKESLFICWDENDQIKSNVVDDISSNDVKYILKRYKNHAFLLHIDWRE